ncbi:MAG: uracil phosphoribosyltransferase [Clostridia bacterium]|nr:uracil phosphoribosyltransferase [Clostridia bacterium]MDY4082679.1 uracil phosphoribosyltransferase [Eubacteriales bacterium]
MKDYPNVMVFDHPLIKHKIAHLRDKNTGMKEFRELVEEITSIMAFEALKDIPTKEVEIETPLEVCTQTMIVEKSVAIVPILRAGLGMVNGIHTLLPTAKVGHIGMYRDEETMEPQAYYCKLPQGIENMKVFLLDPMLATGGSASEAIGFLKKQGVKDITMMSIIAAPAGLERVAGDHPDVKVYVSTLDRELNEHCYILPGLGDAGDRLFGTK